MKAMPEQHDPDWPKYPETILHFRDAKFSIDLRAVLSAEDLAALACIGFGEPFAVMTACDPRGENLSAEENDELSKHLETRLAEAGQTFVRIDACSPGGEHCERSVAVKMPQGDAIALAVELRQMAIFWFDGVGFWIVGALVTADPVRLPRSF
jgi:hypothetical protein